MFKEDVELVKRIVKEEIANAIASIPKPETKAEPEPVPVVKKSGKKEIE